MTPKKCEKENDNFKPELENVPFFSVCCKENTGVQKWPFLIVMQNGSGLV